MMMKDGEAMDDAMMEKDDAMMMKDGEAMDDAMMMEKDKAMTDSERMEAMKMKAMEMGAKLFLQTDYDSYGIGDKVFVEGYVESTLAGTALAITVTGPNGLVDIAQLTPVDGIFTKTFDTSNWKDEGAYDIGARYSDDTETVQIQITEAVVRAACSDLEVVAGDQCVQVPHSIEGGSVTGISANIGSETNSLVFDISATGDGMLEINPPESVMKGAYLVYVNNEESDDAVIDGNTITVPITVETENVEVFAAFVVPEFGTIAAIILAVAIVSIIAVSARSRLSITPKY